MTVINPHTHTPGPWFVGEKHETDIDGFPAHAFPISGTGLAIARVWAGRDQIMSHPWALPNARLIAAAPDMLAALREVEQFLDDQADASDGVPNDAMRHLVEVRAAIAKAEGLA